MGSQNGAEKLPPGPPGRETENGRRETPEREDAGGWRCGGGSPDRLQSVGARGTKKTRPGGRETGKGKRETPEGEKRRPSRPPRKGTYPFPQILRRSRTRSSG